MDLTNRIDRALVGSKLDRQTNDEIDLDLLKAYLEATEKYGNTKVNIRYQALKLKYEAMITAPTIIEKTMSPAQLYASGSPLWAKEYTGFKIEHILSQLEDQPKTEDSFDRALAFVLNRKNAGKILFDEFGNLPSIGGAHGNLLQVALSQKHELQKIEQ